MHITTAYAQKNHMDCGDLLPYSSYSFFLVWSSQGRNVVKVGEVKVGEEGLEGD